MAQGSAARVLIVDDDESIRVFVTMALEDAGYEVRGASNGQLALAALADWRADVILLDLNMPVCDGWQFRYHQNSDPKLATIPVVVMSATYDLARVSAVLAPRATLPKPFDLDELYRVLACA
jgi:CheY-like chemotaxis protein